MLERTQKYEKKFISCIKIGGVPILPPVITPLKKKEVYKYKLQAVKLEKRLKRERELREYINRYYLPKLEESSGIFTESLEHKLSFDSHLLSNIALNKVSSSDRRTSMLSCDLQVSQYTNNEFKVVTNLENHAKHVENVFDDTLEQVHSDILNDDDDGKPRLIRSNSYVLDTPSPFLLEHLKKQEEVNVDSNFPTKDVCSNLIATTFLENDRLLDIDKNTPACDKVDINEAPEVLNGTLKSDFLSESESELRNMSEISHDDVTVLTSEFMKLNEEKIDVEKTIECEQSDVSNVNFKDLALDTGDEEKLKEILTAIPESFSKQIIELLEKQKKEQTIRLNSYSKIRESFLDSGEPQLNSTCVSTGIAAFNKSLPDQSMYYTPDSFVMSSQNECNISKISTVNVMNANNSNGSNMMSDIFIQQHGNNSAIIKSPKTCIRQLFSVSSKSSMRDIKTQNAAASIIQARVKGYLTRRLLRTERVQGLIQTIRDALICAMELHSENADNINESDVELHRRCIQQVSAACYSFHDIFFSMTTSEQMAAIRLDRDRLKEKLKRPHSRKSISRSSRNSRSR